MRTDVPNVNVRGIGPVEQHRSSGVACCTLQFGKACWREARPREPITDLGVAAHIGAPFAITLIPSGKLLRRSIKQSFANDLLGDLPSDGTRFSLPSKQL